jgi:hypothetical protein
LIKHVNPSQSQLIQARDLGPFKPTRRIAEDRQ